jgi:arginine deiminase
MSEEGQHWSARHDETLLMKAIYAFHPDFAGARISISGTLAIPGSSGSS